VAKSYRRTGSIQRSIINIFSDTRCVPVQCLQNNPNAYLQVDKKFSNGVERKYKKMGTIDLLNLLHRTNTTNSFSTQYTYLYPISDSFAIHSIKI
jgi:hypothetical protein